MNAHLEILDAGPQCTIQDMGRPGFRRFGVSEGGAMDQVGLACGAALLGNDRRAAAIEMAATGLTVRAGADVRIALTGSPMDARISGRHIAWHASHELPAGAVLTIGAATNGVYGYLHVGGGVDSEPTLGSRSTHLRAGIGGLDGRALAAGDLVPVGEDGGGGSGLQLVQQPDDELPIRVVWSPQADLFSPETRSRIESGTFVMTGHRDRMGARVDPGSPFELAPDATRVLSTPVVLGDVQVPGDGMPVVLLADRQPTGGYPRIATVISADIARFVQIRPGTAFSMRVVSTADAVEALMVHRSRLRSLADRLRPLIRTPTASELLSENLISGAIKWDDDQP